MNESVCEFFAGSAGDWMNTVVTLLTGAAVAYFAYQANRANNLAREAVMADATRRGRTFDYMISLEVGSAQSAIYNIRAGLAREVSLEEIPNVGEIRRLQAALELELLPNVRRDLPSVHLLPETCASFIVSGLSSMDTARRSLRITMDSPQCVEGEILTPVGMQNIERVCSLMRSTEAKFRAAHPALWAFNYPGQAITEWNYPPGADAPPEAQAA